MMIKGEYGNTLRIGAQENIASNTNSITISSPKPTVREFTITSGEGLSVGLVDKTVGGIEYKAGEYVEYVFKSGDVDQAGEWSVCLTSTTPSGQNKKLGPLFWQVSVC